MSTSINSVIGAFSNPLIQVIDWQAIAPGSSNQVLRGQIDGESYVLRINASTDYAFGVCRNRESKVLRLIQGQAWAPDIIENNLQQGWCLMRDHGPCLTLNQGTKTAMFELVRAIQTFSQSIAAEQFNSIVFDYDKLFASYQQILQRGTDNQLALLLCRKLSLCVAQLPEVTPVLMHQDLHPRNVCIGETMVAIDWEYGGWGQPWLDTAALHCAFEMPVQQLKQLPIFQQLSDADFQRTLVQGVAINNGISCLWHWLRGQLSQGQQTAPASSHSMTRKALVVEAQQCILRLG
ncbi:MAG: phosphotransferase [Oceanospirillaceae bacterium]|nr:phosphotransferase [Oceanospirillaceae bacterium]